MGYRKNCEDGRFAGARRASFKSLQFSPVEEALDSFRVAPKGKTGARGWEMLGSQVSARYAEGISNGGAPGPNRLPQGLGGEARPTGDGSGES